MTPRTLTLPPTEPAMCQPERSRRRVAAMHSQGYGLRAIAKRARLDARAVAQILAYQEQEWRERRQTRKEH